MFHRRSRRHTTSRPRSPSAPPPRMSTPMDNDQFQDDLPRSRSRSLSPPLYQSEWIEEDSPLYGEMDDEENRRDSTLSQESSDLKAIACTERTPLNISMDQGKDDEASTSGSSYSSSSSGDELTPDGPEDMKFSLISNLFFLAGACIQTWVAIMDVQDARWDAKWEAAHAPTAVQLFDDLYYYADDSDDDDDGYGLYYILNAIGPFLYMLNALVDIQWALTLPAGHPVRQNTNGQRCSILRHAWKTRTDSEESIDDNSSVQEDVQEKLWDFLVAVIFGLGACLEFTSTLFEFGNTSAEGSLMGSNLNVVAMHTYLISGILHICSNKKLVLHPGGSTARSLVGAGMLLFCAGSILDCIMSYLYDPDLSYGLVTPLTLSWSNFTSAIMWNTNAIFYVWADFLVYHVASEMKHQMCGTWMRLRQRMVPTPPAPETTTTSTRELPSRLSLPLLDNVMIGTPIAPRDV